MSQCRWKRSATFAAASHGATWPSSSMPPRPRSMWTMVPMLVRSKQSRSPISIASFFLILSGFSNFEELPSADFYTSGHSLSLQIIIHHHHSQKVKQAVTSTYVNTFSSQHFNYVTEARVRRVCDDSYGILLGQLG